MNNHILSVTLHQDRYPSNSHYPFALPIFNCTKQLTFKAPVTFFVGENGTGKSTLLEAIALACNVHIWRRDEGTSIHFNQYEKQFFKYISVKWKNGTVPGSYFGGKSLVTQSHGQSMMSFFESRYKIKGIYFLDEPETALSPKSQLKLLEIIRKNTEKGHAQFIIATHSPILLAH